MNDYFHAHVEIHQSGAASYVRREHPEIFERLVMGVGNFLNTQFIKNRPLDFVKQLLKSWYIFFFQVLGVSGKFINFV